MLEFKKILEKFDKTLQKYNPQNYAKLQPPLPTQEIDIFLDKLNLTHPDFRMLYEWKNGVDLSGGLAAKDDIFGFGVLFPLASVLDFVEKYPHKNPHMISMIGDINGNGLLFNNDRQSVDYGKIFVFSVSLLSIDDPYSYYDSLSAMLETLTKAYQTGIYKYDDFDDSLEIDGHRFWDMAKKLNPGSTYWLQS
jgi:hypothetical protein